ncbi:MAG: hypothetical protein LBT39_07390 [Treponema sp.]|jgi:hypothetical protein|nr:hypothetical protein [Treponema sp.]
MRLRIRSLVCGSRSGLTAGSGFCFLFALMFLLSSCFSPLNPDRTVGSISLNLSGAPLSKAAVSSTEAATLSYHISLTGPGTPVEKIVNPGDGLAFNLSVSPGDWVITIRAYTPGNPPVLRGSGSANVTVRAGETSFAEIQMSTVEDEDDDGDWVAPSYHGAWYVAPTTAIPPGNVSNTGTVDSPLLTVAGALTKIATAYADALNPWPGKAGGNPETAQIILKGSLSGTGTLVSITGTAYPPIELCGDSTMRALTVSGSSSRVLNIADGNTVTLGPNLTLQGGTNSEGAGVNVINSTFIMTGGIIKGNQAGGSTGVATAGGGGVCVTTNGASNRSTFTMYGGEISGNTVKGYTNASGNAFAYGGGVYITTSGDNSRSTFTMYGGKILSNTATSASISNNAFAYGGGVCVSPRGTGSTGIFEMRGGEISDNTVVCSSSTALDINGGGGVAIVLSTGIAMGTFEMTGGSISGNKVLTAGPNGLGGGVYVKNGTFMKGSASIIYGVDMETSAALRNFAFTDGQAVYVETGTKARNTTAGVGVTLNSGISGSAGGWQ